RDCRADALGTIGSRESPGARRRPVLSEATMQATDSPAHRRARLPVSLAALGITFAFAFAMPASAAPDSPVGLWKNIDDKTGEAKALIRIEEVEGVLSGRIESVLTPGRADATCEQCEGELKD